MVKTTLKLNEMSSGQPFAFLQCFINCFSYQSSKRTRVTIEDLKCKNKSKTKM